MIWYTRATIRSILLHLIRSVQSYPIPALDEAAMDLADLHDDLGLSSIQIMDLAGKANGFFQCFSVPKPPYLLGLRTLGEWIDHIVPVCAHPDAHIGFASSGTGGQVRMHVHSVQVLEEEVAFLQSLFQKPEAIISLVPAYHIYGFLFGVLLPAQWNLNTVWDQGAQPGDQPQNNFYIGTPSHWQYLYDSYGAQPSILRGVSSGAPLDQTLYQKMHEKGWQLADVYGSTETGGIGYRMQPDKPFVLFPYWTWVKEIDGSVALQHRQRKPAVASMDRMQQLNEREFELLGRLDGAVQVGGINIYPDHIAYLIKQIKGVNKCSVYAKALSGHTRLYGTIYLQENTPEAQQLCLKQMRQLLSDAEYPASIHFG